MARSAAGQWCPRARGMTDLLGETRRSMPQPSAARGREQQEHDSESRWSTATRIRLALAVAVLVAVPALWTVEPVRRVLRESFTRMPSPYSELYFPQAPAID